MAKDLTAATVRNTKARLKDGQPVRTEIPDGKTRGLFLIVQPSGAKSWALRYRFAGKPAKLTIGPVLEVRETPLDEIPLGEPHTLSEARLAADKARAQVATGQDPKERQKAAMAAPVASVTVEDASKAFMVERKAQARNRAAHEIQRQFDVYINPAIGAKPIDTVTGDDARGVIKALVKAGSPLMANRVHATLATFFKWAADADQKLVAQSPYKEFSKPSDEKSRDRVLSNAELAALWNVAGDEGQPFGTIVRLLILTGQRRSEVSGIRDSELDLNARLWTIPAERAKNGQKHIVGLSPQAVAELAGVERIKSKLGLWFTTTGKTPFSGHSKAKGRIDGKLGFAEAWRLHDIRRTVSTGMAALGEPVPVVEAILNHVSGTRAGVAGIYNRHAYSDEAELALESWGRFITDIIAHDDRRLAWDAMRGRDRARARLAIHDEDETWQAFLARMDEEREAQREAEIEAADNVVKLAEVK